MGAVAHCQIQRSFLAAPSALASADVLLRLDKADFGGLLGKLWDFDAAARDSPQSVGNLLRYNNSIRYILRINPELFADRADREEIPDLKDTFNLSRYDN